MAPLAQQFRSPSASVEDDVSGIGLKSYGYPRQQILRCASLARVFDRGFRENLGPNLLHGFPGLTERDDRPDGGVRLRIASVR